MKNGNDNWNSVVRSHGKTKNENRSSNFVFNVVGKRKAKIKVRILFSDDVGKRKTKLEVWISFSHVVGKRLALRYTYFVVPWSRIRKSSVKADHSFVGVHIWLKLPLLISGNPSCEWNNILRNFRGKEKPRSPGIPYFPKISSFHSSLPPEFSSYFANAAFI